MPASALPVVLLVSPEKVTPLEPGSKLLIFALPIPAPTYHCALTGAASKTIAAVAADINSLLMLIPLLVDELRANDDSGLDRARVHQAVEKGTRISRKNLCSFSPMNLPSSKWVPPWGLAGVGPWANVQARAFS